MKKKKWYTITKILRKWEVRKADYNNIERLNCDYKDANDLKSIQLALQLQSEEHQQLKEKEKRTNEAELMKFLAESEDITHKYRHNIAGEERIGIIQVINKYLLRNI